MQLLDVLTDDLAALNTATVIILNGGYEFLLLKNLRETHVLERLRTLALAGKPIYGISAGAILLGPDLDLYAYLYPEDNTEQLASTTAINATTIRIYPHYDVHCEVKPQLPQLITDWEHKTGVTVKRLTNNQGLLVHGSQIQIHKCDTAMLGFELTAWLNAGLRPPTVLMDFFKPWVSTAIKQSVGLQD
ncbi:Type 1 glutamine amidotransferase-like domain-containing protein [Lactiplantibacillus plantarum]|uniref:Type 1 glutamine amidotransferase-like domain-containing protein n=1 Tax=Lactiplantibacillus plantarum TaxID=1590 RepID=UPI0037DD0892